MTDVARIILILVNMGLMSFSVKMLYKDEAESWIDWALAVYAMIVGSVGACVISFLLPGLIWGC